jgi:hypothetical protein
MRETAASICSVLIGRFSTARMMPERSLRPSNGHTAAVALDHARQVQLGAS